MVAEKAIELLREQRKAFLEMEGITERMVVAESEELEKEMEKRNQCFERARQIQQQLAELSGENPQLAEAIALEGNEREYTGALAEVYEAAYAVRAVVNRLLQNDVLVRERLEIEREKLLGKIQMLNQSGSAVAQRYRKSVQAGYPRNPARLGKNV